MLKLEIAHTTILEPLLEVDLGGDGRDDRGEHDQQPHPFRNRRRWGRSRTGGERDARETDPVWI